MNQTSNYQLSQWDPEDRILRTDFNSDNAKVDAALKGNADAISSEASARSSAVTRLENKIAQRGNCKVEIHSYTGDGQNGSAYPCSQTFSKEPVAFFVTGNGAMGMYLRGGTSVWVQSGKYVYICNGSWNTSRTTFSWYASSADIQLNVSGVTYTVIALSDCDE